MNIATQKNKYFLAAADAKAPTLPPPVTYADSKVTPLIGCKEYAAEVEAALARVGTKTPAENKEQFVLVHNWWLGLEMGEYVPPPDVIGSIGGDQVAVAGSKFYLDGEKPPDGTRALAEVLKQKAKAGVDVRVLGWLSFAVMGSNLAMKVGAATAAVNAATMASIVDLRSEPALSTGAALDVLGHTAGAVHTKLVVIGDATQAIGFTGGLDFVPSRWAETWHDIVVKVEGPAVQGLYDWFRLIWNENAGRKATVFTLGAKKVPTTAPGTSALKTRALATTKKGSHHVQSVRTVPVFKYTMFNIFPENRAPAEAPNGLFEIRAAWEKAIRAATDYIYIEDQAFWSVEVFEWVNAAIRANANLRVILMASGGADPDDPEMPLQEILTLSIDNSLLKGLTGSQLDQIRMFRRFKREAFGPHTIAAANDKGDGTSDVELDPAVTEALPKDFLVEEQFLLRVAGNEFPVTANAEQKVGDRHRMTVKHLTSGAKPPGAGDAVLVRYLGVAVHSKTTLVDDHWAIVGSANCMRRSLYTDWEHSVVFLDEADTAVKEYRKKLWAFHFGAGNIGMFDNLASSLRRWEPSWGVGPAVAALPPTIRPVTLPIKGPPLEGLNRRFYEVLLDVDSRQNWGGLLW
ncbi:MAG TPA: phospholipase D-like domain-containing protein [Gaiellaceae bacterium]|jgi:phosphatidylserine/phosphatidylglycerophosphate/cardiolipin synthase-like enzyme